MATGYGKSKLILTCFASSGFFCNQKLLCRSAVGLGVVDGTRPFNHDEVLKTEFGVKNQRVLKQARGAGYWLWKPYIILATLKNSEAGDWVLYSDVGRWPRMLGRSIDPLIEWCDINDQPFLPGVRLNDLESSLAWTKVDCAKRFKFDKEKLSSFKNISATWSLWSNTPESINFLEEWLSVCLEKGMIDDRPSSAEEEIGYIEHRHDQAVLSCLAEKYEVKALFEEETIATLTHRECKDLDGVLEMLGSKPMGSKLMKSLFKVCQIILSTEEFLKVYFRKLAHK